MKISEDGIALITRFEGLSLTPYRCRGGKLTIGFGHTATHLVEQITREQAHALLMQDIQQAERTLNTQVNIPLTQCQFDALCSLVFNIGEGNFQRSTLRKKLNDGKIPEAAEEFLKWHYAGGKPLKGLKRRRQAERALFLRDTPEGG